MQAQMYSHEPFNIPWSYISRHETLWEGTGLYIHHIYFEWVCIQPIKVSFEVERLHGLVVKSDEVKNVGCYNMIEHADGLEHGLRYMHPCRTNFAWIGQETVVTLNA